MQHVALVLLQVIVQGGEGTFRLPLMLPVEPVKKLQGAVVAAEALVQLLGKFLEAAGGGFFEGRLCLFLKQPFQAQLLALFQEVRKAHLVKVDFHRIRKIRQRVTAGEQQGAEAVLVEEINDLLGIAVLRAKLPARLALEALQVVEDKAGGADLQHFLQQEQKLLHGLVGVLFGLRLDQQPFVLGAQVGLQGFDHLLQPGGGLVEDEGVQAAVLQGQAVYQVLGHRRLAHAALPAQQHGLLIYLAAAGLACAPCAAPGIGSLRAASAAGRAYR